MLKRRSFEYKAKFEKKRMVFPPYFVYDFSRKIFLLTDQMKLLDCLYFLKYWAIWVLQFPGCFPGYDVINFEINFIFLNKPFSYITKKVKTKNLNILRTKRCFKVKQKAFFIIFKGLPCAKNGLRTENGPLTILKDSFCVILQKC